MKQIGLLLLLLSFCGRVPAQEHFLSGTWEGNYSDHIFSFLGISPRKLVVDIHVDGRNRVTGSSHLYYRNSNHYEHYTIKGYYKSEDSTVFFAEDSVLAVNVGWGNETCTGDYTLKLRTSDTLLRLKGRWKDNINKIFGCGSSGVWLERAIPKKTRTTSMQSTIHPTTSGVADRMTNDEIARESNFQSLIELDKHELDSIKLEVKDNADVDGDVVSIYLDGNAIIRHLSLKAQPAVFYMQLSAIKGIQNLVMTAESQGSIPPCTALMKVITRKHQYEVSLSSDNHRNAVLQFFLKE